MSSELSCNRNHQETRFNFYLTNTRQLSLQRVEMVATIDSELSSHDIAVISLDIFQPGEGSAGPELIINLCF